MSGPCRSFFHTICVTVGALMLWAGLPALGLAQQRSESCARHSGTWIEQYQECEYASKEWCDTEGGGFDECGSACRHDPNPARPCTMQCVPVCRFPIALIGEDPEDSTYVIEGRAVTLKDIRAEEPAAPDSATTATTRIFKLGAKVDLNGDGRNGAPVLLVQNSGGTGSFFYVAAALSTGDGYRGTNAILIGDRIAPQALEMHQRTIIVTYADRYPWEGFAVRPSVSRSRYFVVENGQLRGKPFRVLSPEAARKLVISTWGDCERTSCREFIVNVLDGRGGAWYVEAIYDGTIDDSVRAERKIAEGLPEDGDWKLGNVLLQQHSCRSGRGHEDFSSEACR
jgi:hypothetical protein